MSHQSLVLTNFNQFEVRERNLAELAGDNAIVRILKSDSSLCDREMSKMSIAHLKELLK